MTTLVWSDVRTAIVTWVGAASGLGTSKVWWGLQAEGARRAKPYIAMRIMSTRNPGGRDWVDIQDAANPTAGAEIEHIVRGNRIITLQLQAFADESSTSNALQILDDVMTKVRLPSAHDALYLAGVSVLDHEPVQSTEGVINTTQQESRAVVIARLSLASEVSETGTYIEVVNQTITIGS